KGRHLWIGETLQLVALVIEKGRHMFSPGRDQMVPRQGAKSHIKVPKEGVVTGSPILPRRHHLLQELDASSVCVFQARAKVDAREGIIEKGKAQGVRTFRYIVYGHVSHVQDV